MCVRMLGFCRISAADQNETRQLLEMKQKGVKDENIYIDRKTGSNFDRPQYIRMLSDIKEWRPAVCLKHRQAWTQL